MRAIPRDTSRQGKFSKILRIEMETNHIIMTMGMYQIEPPWVSICLIQTYKTNIDIGALNRDKKFQCILVIWGKFYDDIQGWQADFELPGRGT
jgi:hypothetical protein